MSQVPKSQGILDLLIFERATLTLIYSSCNASHENDNKNNCPEESMNQAQSHIKNEKKDQSRAD